MSVIRPHWFPLLCALIALVSLYDTFLIVQYSWSINLLEENPVGRWLLNVADGEVGVFVRVKLAGTVIVLTILAVLKKLRSRKAFPVTTSVAAWQAGLFTYLVLA